jgi:hypothetical protein
VLISTRFKHSSLRDYHRLVLRKMVPRMLTVEHRMRRIYLVFTFRAIPQRWRWISQLHLTNNRYGTLGFICERWSQTLLKAVDARTYNNQTEKNLNKNCLLARNLTATVLWDRKGLFMASDCTANCRPALSLERGPPRRQYSNFYTETLIQQVISGHKSLSGLDT